MMIQNIAQLDLTFKDVVPIYRNTTDNGIFLTKIEICNQTSVKSRFSVYISPKDSNTGEPEFDATKHKLCAFVTLRGYVSVVKRLNWNLMPFQEIRVYAENDELDIPSEFLISVNLWGDI